MSSKKTWVEADQHTTQMLELADKNLKIIVIIKT